MRDDGPVEITDDYMRSRLQESREYSIVLLWRGPANDASDRDRLVWEHGRRNFALLEQGVLPIVCPVPDDSELCGVGIFNASTEETARIMDDDPGVIAGIFVYEVHPARGFPGSRLPA